MTTKQKLFCDYYLANGFKAKKAYIDAYGNTDNKDPTYPYTLLAKPEIKEYIEQRRNKLYESLKIDANRIMEETAKIAFSQDGEVSMSARLRALELLSKNMNLQTLKIESKDIIEVQLIDDEE